MAAVQKLVSAGTSLVSAGVNSGLRVVSLTQKAVKTVAPHAKSFLNSAKTELVPPLPAEFGEVTKDAQKLIRSAQTGAFLNLTVREAAQKSLVGLEILSLFFVGEIIGRGSLIGYKDRHADADAAAAHH